MVNGIYLLSIKMHQEEKEWGEKKSVIPLVYVYK